NTSFNFANVLEVLVQSRAVGRTEVLLDTGNVARNPVENTDCRLSPSGTRLRRSTSTEQLIEHDARVANLRQRFGWRSPADGIGIDTRVTIRTAAGLIHAFD